MHQPLDKHQVSGLIICPVVCQRPKIRGGGDKTAHTQHKGGTMTYTIIEVERKSGIPSRKIRFWLDKGLFPHIYKDKNGVRLFSAQDVDWLCWIELYRQLGMSIKDIAHYRNLADKGDSTLQERLGIIQSQKAQNLAEIAKLQEAIAMLEYKENLYIELITNGSAHYKPRSFGECKKILEQQCHKKGDNNAK